MKIKTKLILTISAALVLAFTGTNLASYLVSRDALRSRALHETLPLISGNIYSDLLGDLMRPIDVSALMAHDTFLKDWTLAGEKDPEQITRYLNEIKQRYGFFTAFFVSEYSGRYYHYQGIHKTISPSDAHDAWYYSFKKKNKNYELDVDVDETGDGALTVFINHRVVDYQGKFLGVAGMGLKMSRASRILQSYQKKYHRTVYMVDAQGVVKIHPGQSPAEKLSIKDPGWFGQPAGDILGQKEGPASYEIQRKGRTLLLAVRYFAELGWYLIVEQDQGTVLSDVRTALYGNLALGFLVTVFVIIIVVLTLNQFQGRPGEAAHPNLPGQGKSPRAFFHPVSGPAQSHRDFLRAALECRGWRFAGS